MSGLYKQFLAANKVRKRFAFIAELSESNVLHLAELKDLFPLVLLLALLLPP